MELAIQTAQTILCGPRPTRFWQPRGPVFYLLYHSFNA